MVVERLNRGVAPGVPTASRAHYGALLERVREAGLLHRTLGFYATLTVTLAFAAVGTLVGLAIAPGPAARIVLAAIFGVVLTQLAFLGHEASHRQVFETKRNNDTFGRLLSTCVGISYSWWMNKHTRHHANPNRIAHDPDIGAGVLAFRPERRVTRGALRRWFLRHQGTLFFPLLLLEGVNLHYQSVRYLLDSDNPAKHRRREFTLLCLRLLAAPVFLFLVMPFGSAILVLCVTLGVFGVYMGASFAPNHKGMPQVPAHLRLSFIHKQVLTSRNISGFWMTALFGGLDHQIEHHLFPNMARPHLHRAAAIVRTYCAEVDIPYTSVSLVSSYKAVVRHLNAIGIADREVFTCPIVMAYGRR